MTNSSGLLRQTIYYPYKWALEYGRGAVLNLLVESPTYEVSKLGQVPYVDVAGTMTAQDGKVAIFALNRDLSKAHVVEINWQDRTPGQVLVSTVLTGSDLKAFNTFDTAQKVAPQTFAKPITSGGRTKLELPARSYTVIQWSA
jgi:alpha-N-arabinofuranosidase